MVVSLVSQYQINPLSPDAVRVLTVIAFSGLRSRNFQETKDVRDRGDSGSKYFPVKPTFPTIF
jgi:hypothetical protein